MTSKRIAERHCQGDLRSQEVLFVRALAVLLRFGLSAAEETITVASRAGTTPSTTASWAAQEDFEDELNEYFSRERGIDSAEKTTLSSSEGEGARAFRNNQF
jgi:hypothetical protein